MNRSGTIGMSILAGLFAAAIVAQAAPFEKEFKVAKVVGDCSVSLPDGGKQAAKDGESYPYGSTVKTGRKASLVVVLSEGNEIRVLAETTFVADQNAKDAADKTIRLREGRIQVKLDEKFHETNKFTVETPSAICGAIGCEFSVETEGSVEVNASTIEVTEGKVKITYTGGDGKSGEIVLNKGDKVRITSSIGTGPNGERVINITMVITRADGTTETVTFWIPWTALVGPGGRLSDSISRLFTSGTTPTPVGRGRGRR